MPFRSQAQRRLFHRMEQRGELPPGTCERWQRHTPKDADLPDHVEKKAYLAGATAALHSFGLEKSAGFLSSMGQMGGRALQWGSKALGFLPTGIGNAAGAVVGGVGGALQGISSGQGWRGALAHGAAGAATGAMPLGTGMAVGAAATPFINGALRQPSIPNPAMPRSIGTV